MNYIFLYLFLFLFFFTVKGLRPFDRHPAPRQCINLTSVCVCSGVCVEGIRASLNIILAVNLEWLEREWTVAVHQSNDRPFASKKSIHIIPANRNDPTCVIASTRKNFLHIHIRRIFVHAQFVPFIFTFPPIKDFLLLTTMQERISCLASINNSSLRNNSRVLALR